MGPIHGAGGRRRPPAHLFRGTGGDAPLKAGDGCDTVDYTERTSPVRITGDGIALFAYNHATWYVNDVLRRAAKIR